MNEAPIIPPNMVGLPPMDADHPRRPKAESKPKRKPNHRHAAGRFGVLNAFIDETARTLTRSEFLTWLILYRDTKPEGTTRTAQADIARRAGTDARTVRRALKRLTASGLVRIVRQGGFRKGVSVYAVDPMPTPQPEGSKSCRR
jgi:predicted transcriptional regulator